MEAAAGVSDGQPSCLKLPELGGRANVMCIV